MGTTEEITVDGAEDLDELVNALNLSTGYSLYVLTCDTPAVSAFTLAWIEREVSAKRGKSVVIVHLDPYRVWISLDAPIPREVLAREVLERIGRPSLEASADNAIHVIDASGALMIDGESWKWLFQRMNEQRNHIRQNIKRELIVLLPPWLVNSFRRDAADFWNPRSGDFRVLAGPVLEDPCKRSPWSWEPMDASRRSVQRISTKSTALGREVAEQRVASARTPREQASALTHMADVYTDEAIANVEQARAELDALKRADALRSLDKAVEIRHEVIALVLSSARAGGRNRPMLGPEQARAYLAGTLVQRGYVLYEDGRLERARADGEGARDNLLALLGQPRLDRPLEQGRFMAAPEEPRWWSDLAQALLLVGDVDFGNLDLEAAFHAYEASLHLAMRFVERGQAGRELVERGGAPAGKAEWRRLQSVCLDRIGDAHFARGELDLAMRAYREALAIVEALLAADPHDLTLQADLVVSRDRRGDLALATGDVELAAREVEEAVPSSKNLAGYSLPWKRDRSVAEINLGDVYRALGKMDAAVEAYLSALATRRDLLRRDRRRPEWIRDVAIALQRLGQVHAARGDVGRAQLAYAEAIAKMRGLVEADPQRAAWRLDLVFLLERHGNLLLERGEVHVARECFEQALTLIRGVSDRAGTSAAFREGQRRVLEGLHEALVTVGDQEGARVVKEALRDTDGAS